MHFFAYEAAFFDPELVAGKALRRLGNPEFVPWSSRSDF
jgi:hypothetical protein